MFYFCFVIFLCNIYAGETKKNIILYMFQAVFITALYISAETAEFAMGTQAQDKITGRFQINSARISL